MNTDNTELKKKTLLRIDADERGLQEAWGREKRAWNRNS
jgi:hypothetical protein